MPIRRSLLPVITIRPPDVDGDVVVSLKGLPSWHLSAHGKTLGAAVTRLGKLIVLAEADENYHEARTRLINILADEDAPPLDLSGPCEN